MTTAIALSIVAALPGGPGEPQEVALRAKVVRNWTYELPRPSLAKVGQGFAFDASLGASFAAERQGTGLAVDTDGDGATDVVVEGRSGFVTLKGKNGNYAARLFNEGGGWQFQSSSVLVGKVGRTKVQLIDQDNNGRFDDFGVDAMIVGRGKHATFLSEVVTIGDAVYGLTVAADGSSMTLEPFEGAVGTLDLRSDMDTKGKLVSAVVVSDDGRYSFDLARGAIRVPAGTYRLHGGRIALGDAELSVRRGRAKDLLVADGATVQHGWGGPARAEFDYARKGEEVVFSPDKIWYYGKGGEEYFGWNPVGKSPEFLIEKDGEVFASAILPGSC